jgi:hypothetical protein
LAADLRVRYAMLCRMLEKRRNQSGQALNRVMDWA